MPGSRLEEGIESDPLEAAFVTSSDAGVEKAIAPPGIFQRATSVPFR